MEKVLITGGSGLLGQYLNLSVSKKFSIHTIYKNNPGNCKEFSSSRIDILNENELKMLFQEFKPEVVIHTAAITNPVPKENQSTKDYFETNVKATNNIALLCESCIARNLFISQLIWFTLVTVDRF